MIDSTDNLLKTIFDILDMNGDDIVKIYKKVQKPTEEKKDTQEVKKPASNLTKANSLETSVVSTEKLEIEEIKKALKEEEYKRHALETQITAMSKELLSIKDYIIALTDKDIKTEVKDQEDFANYLDFVIELQENIQRELEDLENEVYTPENTLKRYRLEAQNEILSKVLEYY